MDRLIPAAPRALCRVAEIPDGGAKGFPPPDRGYAGLFAVRRGAALVVYVNSCPHLGVSLEWTADRFLSADGTQIVCGTHGAVFRIADGHCVAGPCQGEALTPVPFTVTDGVLLVAPEAGRYPDEGTERKPG